MFTIREDNKAELSYSLTCSDVDAHSHTRLSTYESLVQEAAGLHATKRGIGIYDLQKLNRTWVIARSRMVIHHYSLWPQDLTVTTWAQDSGGFNCPRHVEAADSNGTKLFDCETKWAIIDFSTGRPVKASTILEALKTPAKDEQGESKLPSLVEEDARCGTMLASYTPQIRYLDTDLNRHVNNLTYINWCLEALSDEIRDEYKVSLVDAHWIKQCYRHDSLSIEARTFTSSLMEEEKPEIWFDIFRNEEDGSRTRVFEAFTEWTRRKLICD